METTYTQTNQYDKVEEDKKPKKTTYCVAAEKKFPKIRISMEDYNQLKVLQKKYRCKSFGQVIIKLLECYREYSVNTYTSSDSMKDVK